jgi:hypothetical protein
MRHPWKPGLALTRLFGTAAIGLLPLLAPGLSAATEPNGSADPSALRALVVASDDQSHLLTAEPVEGDMDDCGCDLDLEEALAGVAGPAPAPGGQPAVATRASNAGRE